MIGILVTAFMLICIFTVLIKHGSALKGEMKKQMQEKINTTLNQIKNDEELLLLEIERIENNCAALREEISYINSMIIELPAQYNEQRCVVDAMIQKEILAMKKQHELQEKSRLVTDLMEEFKTYALGDKKTIELFNSLSID